MLFVNLIALLCCIQISLQLWDMRNLLSPVREFVWHTKGMPPRKYLLYLLKLPMIRVSNLDYPSHCAEIMILFAISKIEKAITKELAKPKQM